ncbi:L-proline trans-4-hydroxylase-like [Amphibalanus amphitrite]|uniref:L-proline trans-4-hydroxylase-like n=1 Tax=Amphibalanus amphitrite TaxID=1232801 RepID=UPI001C92B83D|nr:L-proline trans-4-hydroxylase-like [Amphibalanus amphitrite]
MSGPDGTDPPSDAVFEYDGSGELLVTEAMITSYRVNGYVYIRKLLSSEEIAHLNHAIDESAELKRHAFGRTDDQGRKSEICVWNHPGDDVLGTVSRTRKVALTAQQLMGGEEVYHYHAKLMMKRGRIGGAFVWHQDYGYWYNNGCMFPDMCSVFMAIDDCSTENGCLQVLRGSHRAGRIVHTTVGEQAAADPARVRHLSRVCPRDLVQMRAGDALFFHCNLLHCSANNDSDRRRFALIAAFNQRANDPLWEHHHPRYTRLEMVPNDAVLKCTRLNSSSDKWFVDPDADTSYANNETDSTATVDGAA